MGTIRRKESYGIIRGSGDDPEPEEIFFCKHCHSFGFEVRLGPRVYKKDEPYPPEEERDKWKMCHTCGTIYPAYELERQEQITAAAQTTENPFEEGRRITGLDNKTPKTRRQKELKKLKDRIEKEKDSEIRQELRKGNTVTIIE